MLMPRNVRHTLRKVRTKEEVQARLREQMGFLNTSLRLFYAGEFAESVRIAVALRVLIHESGMSKPLLKQSKPNGIELPILENVAERSDQDQLATFTLGIRMGTTITPAVDLSSSHYTLSSIGAWWNRPVFKFPSRLGTQVVYKRKQVILILANREGGAHLDENEDPNYSRLLADLPVSFGFSGCRVETPDLARFLTAQSGVEMLECLKRNFFPDYEVPVKWELGVPSTPAQYLELLTITQSMVVSAFPRAEGRIVQR
jgi:hypothetical protein